jgi:hypothetical protein
MNGGYRLPLTKRLVAAKGTRGQISRDDAQETLCDISRWEQMHMVARAISGSRGTRRRAFRFQRKD